MHRYPCVVAALVLLVGCGSNSTDGEASVVASPFGLRSVGLSTLGGEGSALAAALLTATDFPAPRGDRAAVTMTDVRLRDQLLVMSAEHIEAMSIMTDAGASQIGSAYVRRLAVDSTIADVDGNGTNLDEVLADHYDTLAALAGGPVPTVLRPILFPWRIGSAEFAGSVDPLAPNRPTKDGQVGEVELAHVGHAMLGRLMLASGLLRSRRGGLLGAIPETGVLGLLALQQVIAAEETLFASLFLDGKTLGGLEFPRDYDAADGVRWLPRAFRVHSDPSVPGLPSSFSITDRSSGLESLAAMMRVGAELSFLASDANPDQDLRSVFEDATFGRTAPTGGGGPGSNIVTWEGGVRDLLADNCVSCHTPVSPNPPGGFLADSYDNVLRGGRRTGPTSTTPIVTRGDPENSILYRILLPNPPARFPRMPRNGRFLLPPQTELVRQWILDGARSAPPGPPRVGLDLAMTMFKNLVAMHLGPNGVLFERHDGDAPVGFANPAATGAALQALAAMAHLRQEIDGEFGPGFFAATLSSIAGFAAEQLVSATGDVVRNYDVETNTGEGTADVLGYARIVAGLLAAERVVFVPGGEAVATQFLARFFDAPRGTFRVEADVVGARYSPVVVAAIVDALREMAEAKIGDAVAVLEMFMVRMAGVMTFSESRGAEILGDGSPDTDGNRIPEPALAGGEFGLAPVFVAEILEGQPRPLAPVALTWSRHIQPLLRQNCAICHMDGSTLGDGYHMDTAERARRPIHGGNPMPLIKPFDPENSFLYRKLVDRVPAIGGQMPLRTPPLSPHGKALVRQWILEGATGR